MHTPTPIARPAVSPLPDIVGLGGALAGLGGGVAMAIVAALISASMGQDIWHESKRIAVIVYGNVVMEDPGFVLGPVLMGTLLHLAVSAALGALFGIVTRRWLRLTSDFGTPLLAGLIYGMLIWLVAYFVALPIFDSSMREIYAPAFIIQHITYGAVTGLLYTWLRPLAYSEFA